MIKNILGLFKEQDDNDAVEHHHGRGYLFDRIINITLMLLMGVVVVVGVIDLAYELVVQVFSRSFLQEIDKMPEILALFLSVLIAIELLDSVRTYFGEHHLHVETVVSVAVIAVARKIIILDLHADESLTILSLAAVVIAVCAGYYLVRKSHGHLNEDVNKETH
jgi:uncharacterized membrane protein (DUF373 family)